MRVLFFYFFYFIPMTYSKFILKGVIMKKTIGFQMVVGVAKGYFHDLNGVAEKELVEKVAGKWQEIAEEKFKETGVYVSAVTIPGAVVYSPNWGCPQGGESAVVISGVANPTFIEDLAKYKEVVLEIAKALKEELEQSTLTVEFYDREIAYLTD